MFLRQDFKAVSEILNLKLIVMKKAKEYGWTTQEEVWVKSEEAFGVIYIAF